MMPPPPPPPRMCPPPPPAPDPMEIPMPRRDPNDPLVQQHLFNQLVLTKIPLAKDFDRIDFIFDYIGPKSYQGEDLRTSMRRFLAAAHMEKLTVITPEAARLIYEIYPQLGSPLC